MPAAYQIKDQTTPHYLTLQVVFCLGLFLKNRRHQQLQRIKQQYTEGSNTIGKIWAGACEYITENGQQKTLTYLSGPEGVFALHVKNSNGTENIRYIHKDHLGSWHTITDENGNLLQELGFDLWGTRRNPATWCAFSGKVPAHLFYRGFTGHSLSCEKRNGKHLYSFQHINMLSVAKSRSEAFAGNGRMYAPLVSRMTIPTSTTPSALNTHWAPTCRITGSLLVGRPTCRSGSCIPGAISGIIIHRQAAKPGKKYLMLPMGSKPKLNSNHNIQARLSLSLSRSHCKWASHLLIMPLHRKYEYNISLNLINQPVFVVYSSRPYS